MPPASTNISAMADYRVRVDPRTRIVFRRPAALSAHQQHRKGRLSSSDRWTVFIKGTRRASIRGSMFESIKSHPESSGMFKRFNYVPLYETARRPARASGYFWLTLGSVRDYLGHTRERARLRHVFMGPSSIR